MAQVYVVVVSQEMLKCTLREKEELVGIVSLQSLYANDVQTGLTDALLWFGYY